MNTQQYTEEKSVQDAILKILVDKFVTDETFSEAFLEVKEDQSYKNYESDPKVQSDLDAEILKRIFKKHVTAEIYLEALISVMRRQIFHHHPQSDPKVIHALLMMFELIVLDRKEELERDGITPEIESQWQGEVVRFGRALDKTVKMLAP